MVRRDLKTPNCNFGNLFSRPSEGCKELINPRGCLFDSGSGVRVRSNVSLCLELDNHMVQTWDACERSRLALYLPPENDFACHGPHETLQSRGHDWAYRLVAEERWTCMHQ
jgi:hypothetical protein